jgi:hypothetical protein
MRIFNIELKKSENGISIFIPKKRHILKSGTYSSFEPSKDQSAVKLNIGGAKGHPSVPGWLTVDIRSNADIKMDISKDPLPFEDDSVDILFSSHTLEHIIPQKLSFVLGEFHRVLKKKRSLVRILVPDIVKAIDAYKNNDIAFFETSEVSPYEPDLPLGGKFATWCYSTRLTKKGHESDMKGHVHCFDSQYLMHCLKKAGFTNTWESTFRESICAELRGPAFDRYLKESLIVEGVIAD